MLRLIVLSYTGSAQSTCSVTGPLPEEYVTLSRNFSLAGGGCGIVSILHIKYSHVNLLH